MRPLQAKDVLNHRVIAVEADRHPAEIVELKPREEGVGGRATHVAVFDAGRFCGLVGIKELTKCPPGWIFGDLAAKGSVLRIGAAMPIEEVCAAMERAHQDAAAVIDEAGAGAGGAYLGAVTLDDLKRRLAEHQRAELALTRDSMLAALKDSVLIAASDLNGTIIRVSEPVCALSGYSREEMLGANFRILNSGHHPKEFWAQMWGTITQGGTWRSEVCNRAKDGSLFWMDTTIAPACDEAGEIIGYVAARVDITERKKTEVHLAQSEERTRLIIDTALDAVVSMDQEGRVLRWNAQAERTFGWSAVEAVGRPLDELIIPERLRAAHRAGLARFAAGGEARASNQRLEMPALRKDGAEITVELAITPIRSGSGASARVWFSAFLRDVTEQKQAGARLRDSEQRLDRVLANIHDAVIMDDVDGRLVYANRRFFEVFGIPEQDPRSIALEDYVPPEWREKLRDRHDRRVRGESVTDHYEYQGLRADGTRMWLEIRVVPVVENGRIIGTQSAIRDITERKHAENAIRESEARLLEAQRLAQIGSWDLDIPTGKLFWSDTIFEIFEIDKRVFPATYEAFLGVVHPDDREMVNTTYTRSVRDRTPYDIVHRLRMPDGRVKHVNERCETFYDEQGRPVRSAGTVQDISERLRLEAERARAAQREALATLAGGIAHEFNSTLLAAGIYLNGSPTGPSGPDPSIAKAAVLIQQAQSLSASLLELFAGPESVEPPILPMAVWLPECVGRLADSLPPGVFISLAPISELKPVYADPLALEQVVRILIGNALDAIGDHGAIRVAATAAGGQTGVEIRVIDEGPGIPEADRARVFEPFFTTRSRSRRSGLGLALATRLVERVGGLLFHEPNTPTGSIFVVRLRVATLGTES